MAEGAEEVQQQETTVTPPETVVDATATGSETPAPAAGTTDDDREPGGDTPEAIYARKKNREAKEAKALAETRERELAAEREARIRLEERTKLLEEKDRGGDKTGDRDRPYTKESVLAQGFSEEQYQEYLIDWKVKKTLRDRETQAERLKPVEKAARDIEEYRGYVPMLGDERSEDFQKVAREFRYLVDELGMVGVKDDPRTLVTQRLAVERAFGSLGDLKKRKEMERLSREGARPAPPDTGGGGGGSNVSGVGLLSKATPTQVAYWNKAGLSQAQRIKEMEIYEGLKKSGRF